MAVPGLGVQSELQLSVYTTATATWGPSGVCDLYHSSRQCQILNPLREARDRTCVLMDTSQIRFCWATMGTPTSLSGYLSVFVFVWKSLSCAFMIWVLFSVLVCYSIVKFKKKIKRKPKAVVLSHITAFCGPGLSIVRCFSQHQAVVSLWVWACPWQWANISS